MKINVIFSKYVAKGKKVDDKEQGSKDRALGHTGCDRGWMEARGLKLNELSATRKLRMK